MLFLVLLWMVCDISVELGKIVNLLIEGLDVEFDCEMIELMCDLLVYIICNLVDYGIELFVDCKVVGKLEVGWLVVLVW